jgi:iron complex outermembrane recepter protein
VTRVCLAALLPTILFGFSPVAAQRTQDNAVTSAGDAFGVAVGSERIGLYTVDDIRGFNPIEAGNARIEGLYFDQQDRPANRLIEGSTVRVGITAQGFPFPAPTGIVDYRLKATNGSPGASIDLERAAFGGFSATLEANLPIDGDRLAVAISAGIRRFNLASGGHNNLRAYSAVLRWHPYEAAEVTGVFGGFYGRDEDSVPSFFPATETLPPRLQRNRFLGQNWDRRRGGTQLAGVIAKLPIGNWRLDTGVFRSVKRNDVTFADLFRGVRSDGSVASRVIIADNNNKDISVSGEVRLTRQFRAGAFVHNVVATARGRIKTRDFGGQTAIALGASTVNAIDIRTRPIFAIGPNARDDVRQLTLGLAYGLAWPGRAAINIALSRSDYHKTVDFADPAVPDQSVASAPVLYNINGSAVITKRITLFGGYVKGLEESLIAPDVASNRNEAPPAIITEQTEAGVRIAMAPRLSLVAGVFSVRKPYFGLDPALRFGQLGSVENRGVELSLTGQLSRTLTMVAGAIVLDSRITGSAVDKGTIGRRPVGSVRRRSILNLDWKPAGQARWSFDSAVESFSSRVGNTANHLFAPPYSTLALGVRYRTKVGGAATLVRIQVTNLFDAYGWLVSNSGGFTYSPARTFTLQLAADF